MTRVTVTDVIPGDLCIVAALLSIGLRRQEVLTLGISGVEPKRPEKLRTAGGSDPRGDG
jgi:hypothetical protein